MLSQATLPPNISASFLKKKATDVQRDDATKHHKTQLERAQKIEHAQVLPLNKQDLKSFEGPHLVVTNARNSPLTQSVNELDNLSDVNNLRLP